MKVECAGSQLLVVNESFHGGWRCTVDGTPAGVLRADGDFLGVAVPGGNHEIRLEFAPKSLVFGRIISGFGLGLIGVILFWPLRRQRD